ncbi:hypothetical protein PV10_03572 [Exophiala mesophila]|uniref:Non-homologous end-joining factor 1 n=1 Tax=Exophiala mesophila TaxID=212818 RepID=A0A0D1ZN11_EXOME|nr:uncharacterized protein PV10_03572 [Exophiala mesophila]KIV95987.1 hypothetical protein PV10_03572 [Exophiala mesophila]
MPPKVQQGWQELQIPSRKECPKLFYLFTTSSDSFLLLLTDLISIWQCSLDKFGIIAEANRQNASIDPSDSDTQFKVLLSKLSQSLQGGQNALARDDKRTSNDLHLITKCNLPRPLKPLKWTFRASQQDTSELAERLLRPSLHEVSVLEAKIASLLEIIREKDHIISRLLDRIGTSGVDLGLIFPSISGLASRKGGQLSASDAQKHVPGMATFDEKSWIMQFATEDGYEGFDSTGLKNLVSGCEKCFAHTREQHEGWLRTLPSSNQLDKMEGETNDSTSSTAPEGQAESSVKRSSRPSCDTTGSDGDFERQPTPPRSKKAGSSPKTTSPPVSPAKQDEGSTDETDPEQTRPNKRRIGGLRRTHATKVSSDKTKSPSSPKKPAASSSHRASSASSGTPTASETQSESETDQRKQHQNSINAQPTQKAANTESHTNGKRRLGRLGKREESISPTRSSSTGRSPSPRRKATKAPDAKQDSKTSTPLSNRRLGRLNKHSAPSPEASSDEDDDLDAPPKTRSQKVKQSPRRPSTPPRRLGRLNRKSRREDKSPSPTETPRSTKRTPSSRSKIDADGDIAMQEGKDCDTDAETNTDTAGSSSDTPGAARSAAGQTNVTIPAADTTGGSSTAQQPEQEETVEQRADRRRVELKRNIAEGVGVKKKRRF